MPETKKDHRQPVKRVLDGLNGRRARMNTQVSIRKARKEDGYNQRRNLAAQAKAQIEISPHERSQLFGQLAKRCEALLIGLQHTEKDIRRKSLRAFVYLMSSGVPPLFDDSDPQHGPLWQTILSAIPFFVQTLDVPETSMQSDAAFALRFIASMDRSIHVIQSGALPKMVVLLQCGISELQIQAAWCLGNVASESKGCCEAVIQVCPPMQVLPHIRMSTPSLRRASVWLLRSMIDMPEILDAMKILTPQLENEVITVLSNVIKQLVTEKHKIWTKEQEAANKSKTSVPQWRLFEMETGRAAPNAIAYVRLLREIDENTVEVMDVDINYETGENSVSQVAKSQLRPVQAIDDSIDNEYGAEAEDDANESVNLDEKTLTLSDCVWAIIEMTTYNPKLLHSLLAIFPKMIELLYLYTTPVLISPLLRLIGNIVSSDRAYARAAVEGNILSVVPHVLTNANKNIREEMCWIVSNIAGGKEEMLSAIIQTPGVIPALVEQLAWAEYDVKRECAWAICTLLVRADAPVVGELARLGVLTSLCPLLDEYEDPTVEVLVLEAINSVLEKGQADGKTIVEESGCLKAMENLCYDDNEDVSGLASQIMDTWFGDEMETQDDDTIAPTVSAGALSFQPATTPTTFDFTKH